MVEDSSKINLLINNENKLIPKPPKQRFIPELKVRKRLGSILVNNSQNWIKCFIKNFNLIKYHHLILIEGFKIIDKLYKLKKIKNKKFVFFMKNGWYRLLITCDNKLELLESFEYFFNLVNNKKSKFRSLEKINIIPRNHVKILNYSRKIWISFGINDYDNWLNLNNAVNDAESLSKFSKKFNFESKLFINKEVTKKSIEDIIKSFLYTSSNYNDLIVISFHGHGHTIKIDNNSYGFFVPHDAPLKCTPGDLISTNDISSWCKYIKSRHILLLFDCCYSGHSVLRSMNIKNEKKYSDETIDIFLSKKARIAINAGTNDQKVSDDGWNNNSIFTGCIMSYPGFYDNFGSAINLYNYLLENVPKHCSQTPTIGKLLGDEGGDIFLAL